MDNTAVLFLSGFHYVDNKVGLAEKPFRLQSDRSFYQRMENRLSKDEDRVEKYKKDDIRYLFILGDLSYCGEPEEFTLAEEFLNNIISEYNIKKENVLILPGNNDIEREKLRSKIRETPDQTDIEMTDYQVEKLSSFQAFYNRFYDNTRDEYSGESISFDPNRAICRVLYAKELDTVFLGINTLYKESFRQQDHKGFINKEALAKELIDVRKKFPENKIVVLLHHKPLGMGISREDEIENWNGCKPIFEKHHINTFVLGGNARSRGCRNIQKDTYEYCEIGALSPCDDTFDKRFSIMYFDENKPNIVLSILYYQYIDQSGDSGSFWQLMDDPESLSEIIIKPIKGSAAINQILSSIPKEEAPLESRSVKEPKKSVIQHRDERNAKEYILKVIKEQNLYKLGYFRWSPKGESISYILMDYFFENFECIEKTKAYYNGVLDYRKIKPDLIIGYEMNGNMMGTLLAIEHECDYTYLPADDKIHIDPERELPRKDYKSIVVFLDLIFTKHLIKIITDKIIESYPSVEKIYYVALIEGTKAIYKEKYDNQGNKIGKTEVEIIQFTNENKPEISDINNAEIYAYSICQIPMITTPFNQSNDFFKYHIIPEYHLYTPEL